MFSRDRKHYCQVVGGIVLLVLCLGQLATTSATTLMGTYESFGSLVDYETLEALEGDAPPILIGTLVGATVGFGSYVVDAIYDRAWNNTQALVSTVTGALTGGLVAACPIPVGTFQQIVYGTLHGLSAHCSTRLITYIGQQKNWW